MPTLYINAGMTGSGKSKINALIKERHPPDKYKKSTIEELIIDDYVITNSYYKQQVRPMLLKEGLNKCVNATSCNKQLKSNTGSTFYKNMFSKYYESRNTYGCSNTNKYISRKNQNRIKPYTNKQLEKINPVNKKTISNKLRLLNKTRYKSESGCNKIVANKLFLALLDDKNIIMESTGRSFEDITWIFYYIPIHYVIVINFVLFTDINELYKRIIKRGFEDSKKFLSGHTSAPPASRQSASRQPALTNYPAPRFPEKTMAMIYAELKDLIQNTITKTILHLKDPTYPPKDVSNLKRIDEINIYDTTELSLNATPSPIKFIFENAIDIENKKRLIKHEVNDIIETFIKNLKQISL